MHINNAGDMMRAYTIVNKDIDRQEKMRWRPLPWLRYIKLYITRGDFVYFPIGMFSDYLKDTKPLSTPFVFNGEYREEQKWMKENVGKTWLIVMKTGKWKSNCMLGLIEKYQQKTLIACHSTVWLKQMVDTFKNFAGVDVGMRYGQKKVIKDITITTHVSLIDNQDKFRNEWFWLVIVDEADRNLTAKMIEALIVIDPCQLYGMTGTPQRIDMDENDMSKIFWPIYKMPDQQNNWYILIPKIKRLISMEKWKFFSFEHWHDLWQQISSDNERTNKQCKKILDLWNKKQFKYGLLLLLYRDTETVMYYEILKELMPTYIMHGKTKQKDDEIAAEKFKETGGLLVGTTGKLGRWLDIPHLDTLFLFYPNKFKSDTIQSVWRILRLDEGKQAPIVYDWCDYPILAWQAKERLATYKKEYGEWVVIEDEYV